MEVEVGLKITHTRDDITSFADLRISKDHSGPLFLSRETESMFLLIAYLQGFKKENVGIKINKEGNQIEITGEKPVQEMVMMGWIMYKKEVELRAFRKVFRIPEAIVLDKIKAKFNDDESALTIIIPKSEKGIRNESIEEVKEFEEVGVTVPGEPAKVPDPKPENKMVNEEPDRKKPEEVPTERKAGKTVRFAQIEEGEECFEGGSSSLSYEANPETNNEEEEDEDNEEESEMSMEEKSDGEETVQRNPERSKPEESREVEPENKSRKPNNEKEKRDDGLPEEESEKKEEEHERRSEEITHRSSGDEAKGESSDKPKKKDKFCCPLMIAGSGILVTIIVMAVGLIRSRRKRASVSSDSRHCD
ncbi:hypothetical protein LINPERPRIM_LOCUS4362 [Linum perenne]